MAQQHIDIGTAGLKDGDLVRDAFSKAENNFTELYNQTGSTSSALTGIWQLNTNAGAVPGGAQVTSNTGDPATSTYIRFARQDTAGTDFKAVLMNQSVGSIIVAQQQISADNYARYEISGAPVDNGTYIQIPVNFISQGGTTAAWQNIIFVLSLNGVVSGTGTTPPLLNQTFTGELALNNYNGTFYNNYVLATEGTPPFTEGPEATVGGYDYVIFDSDGTTPFISQTDLDALFSEKNNVPTTRILESGLWGAYIWKLPNGLGIVLSEHTELVEPDTEAPTPVSTLASSNITATVVTLSWSASTDNVGVAEYEVYQDSVSIGTTSNLTLNVSNLTPETSYDFTVVAIDAAGNESAAGNTVNVTTLEAPNIPIVLEDDFTGTVIDTNKWEVVNPSPSNITITQNETLQFDVITNVNVAPYTTYIQSVDDFDLPNDLFLSFDLSRLIPASGNDFPFLFGFGDEDSTGENIIVTQRVDKDPDSIILIVKENGVVVNNIEYNIAYNNRFKISKLSNGEISFHYWNVNTWTEIVSGISTTLTSGTLKIYSTVGGGATANYFEVDNLFLTNVDYSTETPL